jgi:hypothetical protein
MKRKQQHKKCISSKQSFWFFPTAKKTSWNDQHCFRIKKKRKSDREKPYYHRLSQVLIMQCWCAIMQEKSGNSEWKKIGIDVRKLLIILSKIIHRRWSTIDVYQIQHGFPSPSIRHRIWSNLVGRNQLTESVWFSRVGITPKLILLNPLGSYTRNHWQIW